MQNNKIIGFTVSSDQVDHSDIDLFNIGLSIIHKKMDGLHVYFWGIGDLSKCFIGRNIFTLSFPINKHLDDRNVLVALDKSHVVIENDWLGSIPVFYNVKKIVVSTLINKTISKDLKIDAEGLENYLKYGLSVYGQTPLEDVKFLRYYSKLIINVKGINIVDKDDKFPKLILGETRPQDVQKKISQYINQGESKTHGDIIIPTSGGYDSRLLNLLVRDKKRIVSLTYGISHQNLKPSHEVENAREVSKRLKTKWHEIKLNEFHRYCKEWFWLYGCSVHMHGMYHIEFFKKSLKYFKESRTLLSGIVGDAWSGRVAIDPIHSPKDLHRLAYTHYVEITDKLSKLDASPVLAERYFKENHLLFNIGNIAPVYTIRLKVILLSYLMTIPDYLGMPSWTPFLNFDIVRSMLTLPDNMRKKRIWQTSIFKENNLYVESKVRRFTDLNTLNLDGLAFNPIEPLVLDLLPFLNRSKLIKLDKQYRKMIGNTVVLNLLLKTFGNVKLFLAIVLKLVTRNFNISIYNKMIILKSLEYTMNGLKTKKENYK